MAYADETPGYRLETSEASFTWLLSELQNLESWRQQLDLATVTLRSAAGLPQTGEVGRLRTQFRQFLIRHGSVAGSLTALHRLGQLTDEQYHVVRQRLTLTLSRLSRDLAD